MGRRATIERNTAETRIRATLDLDGEGRGTIRTGIPFMDHMLASAARHGRWDLDLAAEGDLEVDGHHMVEDLGIVLGQAIAQAVGPDARIARFGAASVPMDESLAAVSLDLGGRPYLVYRVPLPKGRGRRAPVEGFDATLIEHFFEALTAHGRITLHVNVPYGRHAHHIFEAVFKAFGRALREATYPTGGAIPSTKGIM